MKPARTVVTRTTKRSVGLIAGLSTSQEHCQHESFLEKAFLIVVSLCPAVEAIHAQPFRLPWLDKEGVQHTYVPDFLVQLKDGSKVVVEVKPDRFVAKHREQLEAASALFTVKEMLFMVVTEAHLTKERQDFAQLCRRYRHAKLPDTLCLEANTLIHSGIRWGEAMTSTVPKYVWYGLLGRHELSSAASDMQDSTRLFLTADREEHVSNVFYFNWLGCSPWRTAT